jgi:hypothetical protein
LPTYHLLAWRCAPLLYELRHGHSPGSAPKVAVIHLGRCEKLPSNATRNLAKVLKIQKISIFNSLFEISPLQLKYTSEQEYSLFILTVKLKVEMN